MHLHVQFLSLFILKDVKFKLIERDSKDYFLFQINAVILSFLFIKKKKKAATFFNIVRKEKLRAPNQYLKKIQLCHHGNKLHLKIH